VLRLTGFRGARMMMGSVGTSPFVRAEVFSFQQGG